jgi:mediator of RNA polymerase II transcription subunit 14
MDGDNWWVVQTRFADPTTVNRSFDAIVHANSIVCSAQVICSTLLPVQQTGHTPLADLGHCLSGFLAIYANGRFLEDLQFAKILPPLKRLKIGYALQVPDLSIEYEAAKLPLEFRIALPAGFRKKAFIKNTLRLTFSGVDRHRNVAIMVAYGKLSTSFQNLGDLIPKDDHSLVFQKTGSGFALRLIAQPAYPVILTLLENLQKLECVLSIYDLLRLKKMDTRSLSLSCIGFAYGPNRDLFAQLDIRESKPLLYTETDPAKLASRTDPLFYLRLGIKFDYSNPHRRIQGALASSLNHPTTDAGLDTFAELLSFTLPLMQALNRLLANATRNEPLKVHVTVRSTKAFQINYPFERCQFKITAHQHQNQPVWVLKDLSNTQNGSGENPFKYKLQESLYSRKGVGWRGLGNGAVAKPDAIGNLLDELDKCLAAMRAESTSKPLVSKPNPENMMNNELQNTGLAKPAEASSDPCEGTGNRNKQQQINAGQKADIIMID